jgi:hypothetical protein
MVTKPKIREKLLEQLAREWRSAETYFIETESDSKKWKVLAKQQKAKLNPMEAEELNEMLRSMGV